MSTIRSMGLLCCGFCYYTWEPRFNRVPKRCPRCHNDLAVVGLRDDELPEDMAAMLDLPLGLYERGQLLRAITLFVSGNLPWAFIILDWLRGVPELEYYDE